MRTAVMIFLALTVAQLVISIDLGKKVVNTDVALQRCRRRTLFNCNRNGRICMRFSRTNLCEYFQSECQQKLANCNKGGITQACEWFKLWRYVHIYYIENKINIPFQYMLRLTCNIASACQWIKGYRVVTEPTETTTATGESTILALYLLEFV